MFSIVEQLLLLPTVCAVLVAPQDTDDSFGLQDTVMTHTEPMIDQNLRSIFCAEGLQPLASLYSLHVHPGLHHSRGRIHYLLLFNVNTYLFTTYLMNMYMWHIVTYPWVHLDGHFWRSEGRNGFSSSSIKMQQKWIEERIWNSLRVNLEFSNIDVLWKIFLRKDLFPVC